MLDVKLGVTVFEADSEDETLGVTLCEELDVTDGLILEEELIEGVVLILEDLVMLLVTL